MENNILKQELKAYKYNVSIRKIKSPACTQDDHVALLQFI